MTIIGFLLSAGTRISGSLKFSEAARHRYANK